MYRTVCGRERNNIDRIDAAVCGMAASVYPRIAPQLLSIISRSSEEHTINKFNFRNGEKQNDNNQQPNKYQRNKYEQRRYTTAS